MNPSPNLITKGKQPAQQRVVEGLREQIVTGKFVPGSQLPGARDLAVAWHTSSFTIHLALQTLAKEGWIDRRPSAGTFITDPRSRFLCAGIYQSSDITLDTSTSFSRNLHFFLLNRLDRLGKKTQVFIDSRPEHEQDRILPALEEALQQRRIQCVIAPSTNKVDERYLARLPVPTAFLSNRFSPNRTEFDSEHLFRGSIRRLARQGCRSVGLMSHVVGLKDEKNAYHHHYTFFRQALEEAGLTTREDWVLSPRNHTPDFEGYGYRAFKKLWALEKRPDGLIAYSDTIARGVITAVLEIGIHVVPPKIKFVFHRNAHTRLLCPFPVTWAISDETMLASTLIELIQNQFNGKRNSLVLIPYVFKTNEAKG